MRTHNYGSKTRYHGKWVECIQSTSLRRKVIYEQGLTTQPYNHYGAVLPTHNHMCASCSKTPEAIITQVLGELIKGTVSLKNLDGTFNSSFLCCDYMKPALAAWRSIVEEDIQKIPNFMTFL